MLFKYPHSLFNFTDPQHARLHAFAFKCIPILFCAKVPQTEKSSRTDVPEELVRGRGGGGGGGCKSSRSGGMFHDTGRQFKNIRRSGTIISCASREDGEARIWSRPRANRSVNESERIRLWVGLYKWTTCWSNKYTEDITGGRKHIFWEYWWRSVGVLYFW